MAGNRDQAPAVDNAPTSNADAINTMLPPKVINGKLRHAIVASRYDSDRRKRDRKGNIINPKRHMTSPHVGDDAGYQGGSANNTSDNEVHSPIDGTVVGTHEGGGSDASILTIRDKAGQYDFRMLHMSDFTVSVGDPVKRGDVVGHEGGVGAGGVVHLHYDTMNLQGEHTDPEEFFGGYGSTPTQPGTSPRYDPYYPGIHMRREKGKKEYFPYTDNPPDYQGPAQNPTPAPPASASPTPPAGSTGGQPPASGMPKPPNFDNLPMPLNPYARQEQEKYKQDEMKKYQQQLQKARAKSKKKKVSARHDGSNIMATKGPDTCNTPVPGGMVPVAYNSTAVLDKCERLSADNFVNQENNFHLNSRSKTIKGHHKGTGKGVIVKGYEKYSHAQTASAGVYSNGWADVRDGDPAWINHPTVGPIEPYRPMKTVQIASLWPIGSG